MPTEPLLGFTLWIEPVPHQSSADRTQFAREIDDYAAEQGLVLDGQMLRTVVAGADRSLTLADQVDLVDWLSHHPSVRRIAISPLTEQLDRPARREDGALMVCAVDLETIGATLLYRLRRITPEMYVHILGGFVRPAG
jgi:hypothetical protein